MVTLTRRDFIKLAATTLGGAVLTGCGSQQLARMTETPRPAIGVAPPPSTAAQGAPASATGAADMILVNGKVITVDAKDTIAQAVAIKDGLIQAVGASDEIRARAGAAAKVVDLKGKSVTPGLIDPHNHLQVLGVLNDQYVACLPPDVNSIEGLQKKLANIVAKTPKGKWIQGYYLTVGQGVTPKKQDLDKVAPEHPVWMMQQGGHYAVANSAALKIANITPSTANPQGGIIERDKSGDLTGVFYNHRAMDLLRRHITLDVKADPHTYVTTPQDTFAAFGVTSFEDNNVRGIETINAYLDVGKQGKMKIRGGIYYTLEWPADVNTALTQIERYKDSMMRVAGFKFLIDGQAPTAFCHQPHTGISWNTSTWEPTMFKRAVRAMHDTGLQVGVHCVGDAAADLVIDAYEEAMKANPRSDPRHRIEHAVITTREATRRMKDLGIIVSTQPAFIYIGGDSWVRQFGEERAKRAVVTREWLDNGVRLALGSDAPTAPWISPQMTLAGATFRPTFSGKTFGAEQCLTIQEALRAHTMGAAYAAHEEKIKGSLEVGKLADFAVWNEDPYSAADHIAQVTIAMTIVGGKVVYQA
ncbi:MAG: amidohydrolase family protein [Anaerolineales bacterium]|nr:amidohydrolase family protein [Anaerolineales bacterium]